MLFLFSHSLSLTSIHTRQPPRRRLPIAQQPWSHYSCSTSPSCPAHPPPNHAHLFPLHNTLRSSFLPVSSLSSVAPCRHGCTSFSFPEVTMRPSLPPVHPPPRHGFLFHAAAHCTPPSYLFPFFSHPSRLHCASLFHRRACLSTFSSPECMPHPTFLPSSILHSLPSPHCHLFPRAGRPPPRTLFEQ